MRSICDSCEAAPAKLFCAADEAALCIACDEKIHGCNKLASRHIRLHLAEARKVPKCDICENAPAFFYCGVDGTSLCLQCDLDVHIGGKKTHERYLLMGQRVELPEHPRSERGREDDLHTDAGTAITGSDQVHEAAAGAATTTTATTTSSGDQPRQEQSHFPDNNGTQPKPQPQPLPLAIKGHHSRHHHHNPRHHHHHHHRHPTTTATPATAAAPQLLQQGQQQQHGQRSSGNALERNNNNPNQSETMEDAKHSSEGDSEQQGMGTENNDHTHNNSNNNNNNTVTTATTVREERRASRPTIISGINESNVQAVAIDVGKAETDARKNYLPASAHAPARGVGAGEAAPQLLLSAFNLNLKPADGDPGLQDARKDLGGSYSTRDGGVIDAPHLEAGQRGDGGDASRRMDVTMDSHVWC